MCQGKVYRNEVIWRSWHQGVYTLVGIDRHVKKIVKIIPQLQFKMSD